ncbi:MAG: WhiB family transcriptional regulator [bacterium]
MSKRWAERARCRDARTDPGDWALFPEDRLPVGSAGYIELLEQLRQDFCWACPVRVECLRDGLTEEYGLRGGLTPEDRRQVLQLTCSCGAPIDPRDLISKLRRHHCTKCLSLSYGPRSKLSK